MASRPTRRTFDRGPLADYLRIRRRSAATDAAHPLDPGVRRTAGLKRAEVARFAGVSEPYYARLEQGINRNPSSQVVDALAGALQLTQTDRAYLRRLAGLSTPPEPDSCRSAEIKPLVQALCKNPCLVVTPTADIVDATEACQALLPGFKPGVNLVRWLFLDPTAKTTIGNWTDVAAREVAALRYELGADASDDRLTDVIGDLPARSPEFLASWRTGRTSDDPSGCIGIVSSDAMRCYRYETLQVSRTRLRFRVYMPALQLDLNCWRSYEAV